MMKQENEQTPSNRATMHGYVGTQRSSIKKDAAVKFDAIYELVKDLYCVDNGEPSVDPVVLFKMMFIQHLYEIHSLRQTVKDVDMNIAYRWFWAIQWHSSFHTLQLLAMRFRIASHRTFSSRYYLKPTMRDIYHQKWYS